MMMLTSPAFDQGGAIPNRFTCDGDDRSPPLDWVGLPEATRALALIVDDPDAPDPAAPRRVWVHWVLYDIDPEAGGLAEGASDPGARAGRNDWGETGYRGPCPPVGRHRYVHQLYALDVVLPDLGEPDKAALLAAMEGHVLDRAELIGTYHRQ